VSLKQAAQRTRVQLYHRWGRLTSRKRAVPGALIIGPRRTGTTSLYQTLRRHSMIYGVSRKEIKYFDCNYQRSLNWYRSFFPYWKSLEDVGGMAIEASPYYIYHPLAAERISKHLPYVKLIALLRNPVDRAYSNYHMNFDLGVEPLPTFEEAIEAEEERLAGQVEKIIADPDHSLFNHMHLSYLDQGIYADQLERWFSIFPREQMLVVQSERFFKNMPAVYAEILDFLDLPQEPLEAEKNANPGKYPPMKAETRQYLVEFFRPHNQRLYDLLGEQMDWDR
jgi:hypothetical protein